MKESIKIFYVRILYLYRFFVLKRVGISSTFISYTKSISSKNPCDLKLGQRRCYSTKVGRLNYSSNSPEFKYECHYDNADESKIKILSDNKGKSGIYMWTNKVNNKRYVGSSVDLRRRILEYFNLSRLMKESSMIINRALMKEGYSKFSLTILEYCDRKDLMQREKHYFN